MKQLDTELLAGYLENLGVAVVTQMLDLYVEQSKVYLTEIAQAVMSKSQNDWQERCHKMKGAAGSVGLLTVHQQLVAIEKSSESWQQKEQYLHALNVENSSAIEAFSLWISQQ
ncbi:Hpt domain-containing protein [Thalassotalea sediminis]|uniref:Hpt domain-containing protein n=1 Tax=Thalassotalea sediminis TaxID=1759089 RepID=UPI002572F071|nr:Hpt domain-containing protein [Thalassotalea sediminis]